MTFDSTYRNLNETEELIVGNVFEIVYLTHKKSGQTFCLGEIYGDPTCGLISFDNDWCLVGGQKLLLWTPNEIIEIEDENLRDIYSLKQADTQKAYVLTDPWASKSAIWELDIKTRQVRMVKEFNDYQNKEYTDNIDW